MPRIVLFLIVIAAMGSPKESFAQTTSSRSFSITDRGGVSVVTSGDRGTLAVGYARIQTTAGTTPAGFAVYGLRQGGVLVSETGVPATPLIQNGRIYAEESATVDTGVAIANPNAQTAVINFSFTDAAGSTFGSGQTTIAANGQMAKFLSEAPFNSGRSLQGTFSFSSNVPVGVIALRGLINQRGEFLITTLPVIDTSVTISGPTSVLSHFADGGGWKTQVVLVNPSDTTKTGSVVFFNQGLTFGSANPISMTVNGQGGLSFPYNIPPRGAVRLSTSGLGDATVVGSVRINGDPNQSLPSAIGVFSLTTAGITVTEAGVPALAATSLRLYAETTAAGNESGAIQTGIAVSNLGSSAGSITFELYGLDGSFTGQTASRQIAGNGQVALFFHELFPAPVVQYPFRGIVRIVSSGPEISAVGLRGRYNERREFLITTTPPSRETGTASTAEMVFPHIVDSGGYTTQFVLYSGISGQTSGGNLNLFSQTGQALVLTFQ